WPRDWSSDVCSSDLRVVTAGIANAVMDGIVPVVIMVGDYPIPAAVVRFKRVMRPTLTSIGARHHNILPVESERPDLRRVCIIDRSEERRVGKEGGSL